LTKVVRALFLIGGMVLFYGLVFMNAYETALFLKLRQYYTSFLFFGVLRCIQWIWSSKYTVVKAPFLYEEWCFFLLML